MDTSTLGRAKREIAEFNAGGAAGFLHHSNGAKEFKKSLHELTDQVPVVGLAFKALLSPIGATLTGATMLFDYFKKQLADWNAELDKAEARNAKPIFGKDDLRAVALDQARLRADYDSFTRHQDDGVKRMLESLDAEQDKLKGNLETEQQRLKLRQELAREILRQSVANGTLSVGGAMKASGALGMSGQKEERSLEAAALAKRLEMLERGRTTAIVMRTDAEMGAAKAESNLEANAKQLANAQKNMLPEQHEATIEAARKELAQTEAAIKDRTTVNPNVFTPYGSQIEAANDKLDAVFKAQSDHLKVLEDAWDKAKDEVAALTLKQQLLNKTYGEAKQEVTQYRSVLESLDKQKERTQSEQVRLKNRPFDPVRPDEFTSQDTFSTSELAGYNTRPGAIARKIEQLEQEARNAAAMGNPALAKQIRDRGVTDFRPGIKSVFDIETSNKGVQALYNMLPKGMTKEQLAVDRNKALVDSIMGALKQSDGGVPVKVLSMQMGE